MNGFLSISERFFDIGDAPEVRNDDPVINEYRNDGMSEKALNLKPDSITERLKRLEDWVGLDKHGYPEPDAVSVAEKWWEHRSSSRIF